MLGALVSVLEATLAPRDGVAKARARHKGMVRESMEMAIIKGTLRRQQARMASLRWRDGMHRGGLMAQRQTNPHTCHMLKVRMPSSI